MSSGSVAEHASHLDADHIRSFQTDRTSVERRRRVSLRASCRQGNRTDGFPARRGRGSRRAEDRLENARTSAHARILSQCACPRIR